MNHRVVGIEIMPHGAAERTVEPIEQAKRKSGQTISAKVTAGARGELVIETRDGAEEAYCLCPNRSMCLHAAHLHLSSDVNPFQFGDDNLGLTSETPLFVRGTATLDEGSIAVIGDPGHEARTLAIDFRALDDEEWRNDKELAQILGKAPHHTNAKVGLARRRSDVGADDAWFVECQVPATMLHALVRAVSCGVIGSISLSLVLRGIYSRGAGASQSVSTDWFLRPNLRDNIQEMPETAAGDITLLNFEDSQPDSLLAEVPQLDASREPIPGHLTQ